MSRRHDAPDRQPAVPGPGRHRANPRGRGPSRRTRLGLLAAGLTVAVLAPMSPVGAMPDPPGECEVIVPSGTTCRIGTPELPADGEFVVVPGDSPPTPYFALAFASAVVCDADGAGGFTSLSDVDTTIFDINASVGDPAPVEPGTFLIFELFSAAGVPQNTGFLACVGDSEPIPTPPPLPTAGEIWGEALTATPSVTLDPFIRGLTGLETFMWYDETAASSDSVPLSLNGYDITATIDAVLFTWDMGGPDRDGTTAHQSTTPGSPADPAATHTYAEPALVTVIHVVTWTGSSVLTGPGLPAGGVVVDLGAADLVTARDYEVIEVRTPLVTDVTG